MFPIRVLKDKEVAVKIGDFLTGPNVFEHTWFPDEKKLVRQAVFDSLTRKNHQYWYIEGYDGEVIAAIGIRENKCRSGGYEMDADYVGVHKDYRREGLATRLIKKVEEYVKEKGGRYVHVLTCDIDSYRPANSFYQSRGYVKVAEMPDYYVEGEGRIDYYKLFGCVL